MYFDLMSILNQTTINLGLTGVLAVATVVLAWTTCTLAKETKRMREFQERPRLSIRVETGGESGKRLYLVLGNEGQAPAKNVRFGEFEGHPLSYSEGVQRTLGLRNAMELPLFRKGLVHWESGQTFTYSLGYTLGEDFKIAEQNPWIFQLQYESISGKQFKEHLEVDLSLLEGPYIPEVNHLKTISDTLSEIQKSAAK